ncbi:MBL fold metallo-hydrolase [Staphylococcus succinus]|uniref:MBL fold metallo-hydrolase n=1 Tax=Staphylococcus succinus TaxID=61015 RepID=A0A9Q6HRF7_9STAP|nr:MBL fold metallo-hydrolase [Staphylococcus succinus]MEB8126862.1 MBL fold metallo-hydrolase [Staphylococcus succinus]MEB8209080.1 MBL fold metallo-hydrolase [Staphylococcus succinus]PTI43036.1 MBL fold metallo-hydrolase [Staphylococcus succinus]PTI77235.1 MBL fold metallo-hydrolase [Staphylococcus succinus]PTJ14646.1 MBL fold metallo-hydrolase [Staphylococcus succinus]
MKLGDFKIHSLNGGITQIDGGAMFGVVPKALWTRKYEVNDKNQIPLPTHPILIQTKDKSILIDTGIGTGKLTAKERKNFGVEYESKIEEDLKALELTVEDIDYVLMTHLHFDHAAGLTDNEGRAIFKNAIHVIQQDEWHEFQSPNIRSKSTYWSKNDGDFKEKLILFEKEIEIYPGIKLFHTGGHSYGHAIVTIESEGEKAVHMGDIFPTIAHRNPLWVTAYDDYPMQSIREKERLIPKFIIQNYWFLYYHDVTYFAVKFDKGNNKEIETYITRN